MKQSRVYRPYSRLKIEAEMFLESTEPKCPKQPDHQLCKPTLTHSLNPSTFFEKEAWPWFLKRSQDPWTEIQGIQIIPKSGQLCGIHSSFPFMRKPRFKDKITKFNYIVNCTTVEKRVSQGITHSITPSLCESLLSIYSRYSM